MINHPHDCPSATRGANACSRTTPSPAVTVSAATGERSGPSTTSSWGRTSNTR
nr:hypothetical protein [Geotalea toluenoxydans]